MDLYQIIRDDHRTVRDELKALSDKTQPARAKERVFLKLWRILMSHNLAEEKVFYTPLLENDSSKDAASEALEEHRVARTVMKEIDTTPPDGGQWSAKLTVLRELLEHHFHEEEGTLFDHARSLFSDEQTQQMAKDFMTEKHRAAPSLEMPAMAGHSGKG